MCTAMNSGGKNPHLIIIIIQHITDVGNFHVRLFDCCWLLNIRFRKCIHSALILGHSFACSLLKEKFAEDVLWTHCTSYSIVGIATGYGLGGRGVGVRVPVGEKISYCSCRPDGLWGPSSLLSSGYRGKAAGAWSWPLTSN
jgi:hypothetical protein